MAAPASGLAATLGAGVFAGVAPAAAASGWWLPLGVLAAALLAGCAASSGAACPTGVFARAAALVARLAAAGAVAGTCGEYLTPGRPLVGALSLLVVVAAVEYLMPEPPAVALRLAVGAVVVVLVVFVVACFALGPPGNEPVPPGLPGATELTGVPAAAALMAVAFGGLPGGRGRFGVLGVVAVLAVATSVAALYQLGGGRLAVSAVPLRDALAAAAGSPIDGLLTFGVALGCGLVLYRLLPAVRAEVAGAPRWGAGLLTTITGGLLVTLLGQVSLLIVTASGVLLCWLIGNVRVLQVGAGALPRTSFAVLGLLGSVSALLALPPLVAAAALIATLVVALVSSFVTAKAHR